jgi:uncharacterized membrane protein YoaK (UPF0700 family)
VAVADLFLLKLTLLLVIRVLLLLGLLLAAQPVWELKLWHEAVAMQLTFVLASVVMAMVSNVDLEDVEVQAPAEPFVVLA